MKIGAIRTESSNTDYQQTIRLQRGLYGGMFSRYTEPKMYQKFQSEEMEQKFFVTCVVTHDAGGNELPYFSEAFAAVRTKAFYDAGRGMKSTFVALWEALLNGKMTPDEIVDAAEANELPDLDEKIGQPLRLFVTPATKPNKNGLYENKIETQTGGFERPDANLSRAILPLYKNIDKQYSTKTGLAFLAKPTAVFESDVPPEDRAGSLTQEELDEIPF